MTSNPSDPVNAPWARQMVIDLNLQQLGLHGGFPTHPYTCANRGDDRHGRHGGDLGVLIATPDGWVCPYCSYTQAWSHSPVAQPALVGLIGPAGFESIGPTREQLAARAAQFLAAYQDLAGQGGAGAHFMVDVVRECLERLSTPLPTPEPLVVWGVYCRPIEYPDHYVARRFVANAQGEPIPTKEVLLADSLDQLRAMAPAGLTPVPRHPLDDPSMVEMWI